MLKYERYLFLLAVDYLFKLIVCRFLYVTITSCLNPDPKVGGRLMGNFLLCLDVCPARSLVR